MLSLRLILPLLATTGILSAADPGAVRSWSSSDGKVIQGSMISATADSVTLKISGNAKPVTVPLSRLSAADRAFVAEHRDALLPAWPGWPAEIRTDFAQVKIEVEQQGSGTTYRTEHFEIVSDAALDAAASKEVAGTFEAIHRLHAASPWGIVADPAGGRLRIELHADREAYLKAGGSTDLPGTYLSEKKVFVAPLESLGLKEAPKGWKRAEDPDTPALVRALTPMMMSDALDGLPLWLIEGTAAYMELMPVKGGTFSPSGQLRNVQQRAGDVAAHAPDKIFAMDAKAWNDGDKAAAGNPSNKTVFGTRSVLPSYRVSAMLMTWYFIHADGEGDALRLRKFIAACRKNARAVEDHRKALAAYDKDLAEFMGRPGVEKLPDGSFTYPKTLVPPEKPAFPFDCKPEQVPFKDIAILLDGRAQDALFTAMRDALAAKRIPLAGK